MWRHGRGSSRRNPTCLEIAKNLNVQVKGAAVASASGNLPPVSGP